MDDWPTGKQKGEAAGRDGRDDLHAVPFFPYRVAGRDDFHALPRRPILCLLPLQTESQPNARKREIIGTIFVSLGKRWDLTLGSKH
jgi:hypothetical protein